MAFASKASVAAIVFLFVLLMFGPLTVNAESPSSPNKALEEKALAYIENVLPLEIKQYTVNLSSHSFSLDTSNRRTDIFSFTLTSSGSILTVNFNFKDGVFHACQLDARQPGAINARPDANLVEAAKNILNKHQNQTGLDSKELIEMLDNANLTKNQTVTYGNLTLTISNKTGHRLYLINGEFHIDNVYAVNINTFHWEDAPLGKKALDVRIAFENGVFHSISDERVINRNDTIITETEPQPQPQPFPTLSVIAALLSVIVFFLGLKLFFKKHLGS